MNFKSAIIYTLIIFSFACNSSEMADIKLHLQKGDIYKMKITQNQKVETKMQGMEVNLNQDIIVEQDMEVKEITPDGLYRVYTGFRRMYLHQNMPFMGMNIETEYDSDHPENAKGQGKVLGDVFSKIIGTGYTADIDSMGKTVRTDVQAFYDALESDSLESEGTAAKYSKESFEQYLTIPPAPVKKGDTFEMSIRKSGEYPMTVDSKYTVTKIEADIVELQVISTLKPSPESEVKMDVKGEQKGTVRLDRKTGMTLNSDVEQNFEITVTQSGITIPMKVSGKVLFECSKK